VKSADLPSRRDDTKPVLYLPREVAKVLRCSEWWVKEQARRGRIPFSWIGGGYRFSDDHLAEIVRLFEKRPKRSAPLPADATPVSQPRRRPMTSASVVSLKARTPRRALRAGTQPSAAA
jgi:hypothetical protein